MFFFVSESWAGYYEKKLLHKLLDTYNVLERPVANESDPLQLSFGITLMQIIDVVSFHSFFCSAETFQKFRMFGANKVLTLANYDKRLKFRKLLSFIKI